MNGTTNTTPSQTPSDKEWKSKTDQAIRYEKCGHCGELVLDNWFMRHSTKCLKSHPNREFLLEQAEQQHQNFKIDLLQRSKNKLEEPVQVISGKPKEIIPEITKIEPTFEEKLAKPPIKTEPITIHSYQKYTFKFGDIVEAVVTDIDKFNIVHVNMINGNPEKKGMIKNTKVRTGIVKDMREHFKTGDKIRAEVNEVRSDGKLWLSTKRFPVPTYPMVGGVFMDIAAVTPIPGPPIMPKTPETIIETIPKKESVVVSIPAPVVEDKQFEEVLTFIKNKIGIVSPEAKAKIKTMLITKGMFTFMMALAKAADVPMDVGLVFAAEIEKQMGNRP